MSRDNRVGKGEVDRGWGLVGGRGASEKGVGAVLEVASGSLSGEEVAGWGGWASMVVRLMEVGGHPKN
ncbi:unnamed protein product [Prunus armeniaca]|uniref:Uncharacterized protein n=1 Tax=Prunus armeniaca TaxID=36596 RepID=A0A6J5X2M8_PRUAR|nr:unnamed protein product [Prunus armeniaca]